MFDMDLEDRMGDVQCMVNELLIKIQEVNDRLIRLECDTGHCADIEWYTEEQKLKCKNCGKEHE
jgi:hypothetical protein